MDARLIDLEVKISFQEDLLDELNKTVARQQGQIDTLVQQVRLLHQQQQTLRSDETMPLQEIPPHY